MRKLRAYVVMAASAVGALALSGVALAVPADQVLQTLDASVAPGRLPKTDFQNAKLKVKVSGCFKDASGGCDPNANPPNPDAEQVIFQFDRRDIAFNTGEAKQCKASREQIAVLSPDQAKSACGQGSVIGRGSALAQAGSSQIPATVTAFNGKKSGGRPHVWLHAFAGPPFNTGTVPDGTLKRGNKLDVKVEPLVSGAARLRSFQVAIKKDAYVQAKCSDKKITTSSKWFYRDVEGDPVTVSDRQNCTQKG
jgi:hypothetical protein